MDEDWLGISPIYFLPSTMVIYWAWQGYIGEYIPEGLCNISRGAKRRGIYCSTPREYILQCTRVTPIILPLYLVKNKSAIAPVNLYALMSEHTVKSILLLSSVYIIQCTHLTVLKKCITVKWVHWPMYTLDSTKNCQKVYIEIPPKKISENILFNAL